MLFFSKIIHLKKSWKAMESCLLWKKSDPPPPPFFFLENIESSKLAPSPSIPLYHPLPSHRPLQRRGFQLSKMRVITTTTTTANTIKAHSNTPKWTIKIKLKH